MTSGHLFVDVEGNGIVALTLDRPQRANALDGALAAELLSTLDKLDDDPKVRVVVLRGRGRHFCGGVDVGGLPRDGNGEGAPSGVPIADLCLKLDGMRKATVAVVQGAAIGAGCVLAACCDAVIAGTGARFAMPEARLGLAPVPLAPFLVRAIGVRAARRYILSGQEWDAATALRLGLVHEISEPEHLDAVARRVSTAFLKSAPDALAICKAALRDERLSAPTRDTVERLELSFHQCLQSAEAEEGRASLRERRKPSWFVE